MCVCVHENIQFRAFIVSDLTTLAYRTSTGGAERYCYYDGRHLSISCPHFEPYSFDILFQNCATKAGKRQVLLYYSTKHNWKQKVFCRCHEKITLY